ncbi:hypothetical protein [Streptomyces tibetensis]|uniref:hypothetical protein n=1 Tax=Streptomyces tibetensis TaxID=2382123 RepID=UPI0033F4BBC5
MWLNGTVLHYRFFGGDSGASVIPVPGRGMTDGAVMRSAYASTPPGVRRDGGDVLVTARIRRAGT